MDQHALRDLTPVFPELGTQAYWFSDETWTTIEVTRLESETHLYIL